ncbi:TRAP transporter large permease [Pusillimonas sp. ANT_WB101]|uniref:TRAP transporter large permease n=1 Tax=Pusillimonas sp. ANT_WB101 TaxID=2597356 RepID=UPI0011ECBAB7|nr:TRAP transporter large permease [Pusillimonas sp. ANT_WB101]KAA0911308.1 TRAP transporter large permease [Pusillimonas sp. ANT_WB101]
MLGFTGALIGLMLLRTPLFVAFLLTSLVYIALFTNFPPSIVVQRTFSGLDKFPLMAVPLFILAANVMGRGGMSTRIIDFAKSLVSPMPGGLALATVLACMLFGAVSGSSPATVIAIGGIMYPALIKSGYAPGFSTGLISASASVSAIIPPSIGMIIYGTVANVSIGKLFIAGIIPGILYGLMFMLYALVLCLWSGHKSNDHYRWEQILSSLKRAIWALGVPIIIIGGIYGGIVTPTESAAVAAVYTIFVAMVVYREVDVRGLLDIAIDSAAITAQIMILIGAASAMAWLLTIERVPVEISQWLTSTFSSKIALLLMINLILVIAGMFLDPTSVTVIFAPLFLPVANAIGVDPIHLGIIILVNGALGMFTPPFGFNLFVASSLFNTSMVRLARAVIPFIILSILVVLMVTFIPALSLWLPQTFKAF